MHFRGDQWQRRGRGAGVDDGVPDVTAWLSTWGRFHSLPPVHASGGASGLFPAESLTLATRAINSVLCWSWLVSRGRWWWQVPFLGVEPMALPPSATELMHQPSISLSAAHDRVVCVLAQLYGLRYCPMLSNLGLLLLRHLSESLTFSVLETLLKDNREEWFQKTWEDEVAFVNTFQVGGNHTQTSPTACSCHKHS